MLSKILCRVWDLCGDGPILEGKIQPGRVFDRTVGLDGVPDGYLAMNKREALKVMVRP